MRDLKPIILLAIAPLTSLHLISPALANDDQPLRLAPSSAWQMKYNEDSCRLGRQFGEGEEATVFYIDRYEPGDEFLMVVSGKPVDGPKRADVFIQFGPDEAEHQEGASRAIMGDDIPALVFSTSEFAAPPSDEELKAASEKRENTGPDDVKNRFSYSFDAQREANITWLSIRGAPERDLVLELGPMGEPMQAMRACVDELLTHWGIDIEAHKTLTREVEPRGSPGNWMGYRDYPTAMLKNGDNGLVKFRLTVGVDGKPTDCSIQESTRPKGFDDAVCKGMMRKAKFKPALDAKGEPIVSFWRNTVRFESPR